MDRQKPNGAVIRRDRFGHLCVVKGKGANAKLEGYRYVLDAENGARIEWLRMTGAPSRVAPIYEKWVREPGVIPETEALRRMAKAKGEHHVEQMQAETEPKEEEVPDKKKETVYVLRFKDGRKERILAAYRDDNTALDMAVSLNDALAFMGTDGEWQVDEIELR